MCQAWVSASSTRWHFAGGGRGERDGKKDKKPGPKFLLLLIRALEMLVTRSKYDSLQVPVNPCQLFLFQYYCHYILAFKWNYSLLDFSLCSKWWKVLLHRVPENWTNDVPGLMPKPKTWSLLFLSSNLHGPLLKLFLILHTWWASPAGSTSNQNVECVIKSQVINTILIIPLMQAFLPPHCGEVWMKMGSFYDSIWCEPSLRLWKN